MKVSGRHADPAAQLGEAASAPLNLAPVVSVPMGGPGPPRAPATAPPPLIPSIPSPFALQPPNARGVYTGPVFLDTTPTKSGFVLRDPLRGNSETRDAHGAMPMPDLATWPKESTIITDTDNNWGGSSDSRRDDVAVDAQYASAVAWDFLRELFGRASIDGVGGPIRSNVHAGNRLVGAYWEHTQIYYGDGDGVNAGPMVSLDIALHEIFHGLTEHTANLRYHTEPGALNEATSDILSAGARWWLSKRDGHEEIDWTFGAESWTPGIPGDVLRSMAHPNEDAAPNRAFGFYDRDHFSQLYRLTEDKGGVHMNSGIANNFFYLLVSGGTNDTSKISVGPGIGMEKGLRIWYRALTVYFKPNTDFVGARAATITAAEDLYGAGSPEVIRVNQAWDAVGVPKISPAPDMPMAWAG